MTINGVKGLKYKDIDLVTIRENTQGEYSGLEHEVVPGIVENLKIITKKACEDINEYAFEYAKKHGRKKITCGHKAGIMKLGDGCFLDTFLQTAQKYSDIEAESK